MKSIVFVFLLFICVMTQVHSFQISRLSQHHRQSSTIMNAKSPSPKPSPVNPVETTSEEPKRAINLSNLLQLVLMGAGAPGLGEFDRMDENGKMFFKLEANNFVDSKGESLQAKAKYFTDGYVDSRDEVSPPGFWQNLFSGGRLQSEWEDKIKQQK